jgi:[acyl-carrier-protein] S-malonyltransferase
VIKTALLFPGQGSQKVGMGSELYNRYAEVRELFALAEEVCSLPVKRLCFEGPAEQLTQTVHLQPALTAVNLAVLTVLKRSIPDPEWYAGHSLGEYSALCAAGVLTLEDTFRLVYQRGLLMDRDARRQQGVMHAVIGLPLDVVAARVDQEEGGVMVANHNAEKQIVITGEPEPVAAVSAALVEKGGRSIPLKVSGAWHSHLMADAQRDFAAVIEKTPFSAPQGGIILNTSAEICTDPLQIKAAMQQQLGSGVRWYDGMRTLAAQKPTHVIEVGPGSVLAGLARKTLVEPDSVWIRSVATPDQLEKLAATV